MFHKMLSVMLFLLDNSNNALENNLYNNEEKNNKIHMKGVNHGIY